jgi:hypothetical protein
MYRIFVPLIVAALVSLPSLAAEEGYEPGYDFTRSSTPTSWC